MGRERGVKLEQPEQKTNRMQRPAGPLGSEPGRVRGAAWLAPGTPHNQDRGRSAPRCGHRSPKPDAHWSPRLPAGKSLNWAHRRAGEKDLVPPAGGREAAVAGWGHPKPGSCGAHTETDTHGLTRLPPLSTRSRVCPRTDATAGVVRGRWGSAPF